MFRMTSSLGRFFVITAVVLLLLPAASVAQTTDEPEMENPDPISEDEETASVDNPPAYINDLVENSDLTMEQVTQMRTQGIGWGNIKLTAELAGEIASQSTDTENPVVFNDALSLVMDARSEDIGFGEIAAEYGLKIGELNRNRNQVQFAAPKGSNIEKPMKAEKPDRPERPEKPEKPEKPEMPERGPQR